MTMELIVAHGDVVTMNPSREVLLGGAVLVRRGGASPPDQAPQGWAERAFHYLNEEERTS